MKLRLLLLLTLLTTVPSFAGFEENNSVPGESVQLTADKPYLNFPIKNDAPQRTVFISVAGELKQKFKMRLTDGTPDWWADYQIAPYKGQAMTVAVDNKAPGAKELALVDQTDAPKYPANLYHEPQRPKFHFTVKQGWNNDANGMVYYEGEYHLFYQYAPFSLMGGENDSWGHAVSKDLVHWKELDVAIYPNVEGDIWSGSTVIDWNNTSGFGKDGKPPMVSMYTLAGPAFSQCLAYSNDNGRTFTKYEKNPVVDNVIHGDRDPKVFWYDPLKQWVLAFFLGLPSDPGADRKPRWASIIKIMNSPDLKTWKSAGVAESDPECPDLFPLPLDGDASKVKWILEAADGGYHIGSFDGATFAPEGHGYPSRFNAGEYYAAQTFNELPKGDTRRIQIVWVRTPCAGMNFTQAMSVPLELTLRTTPEGPRMCSWPVKEVDSLHTGTPVLIKDQPIEEGQDPLAQIKNGPLDVDMEIDPLQSEGFEFTIQGTPIRYNAHNHVLSVLKESLRLDPAQSHVHLRVLSDVDMLEIFAGNGAIVIPELLSPTRPDPDKIGLRSLGGKAQIVSLGAYEMSSIWN